MEIYEFNKNYTQRFEELSLVFDSFIYDDSEKISALEIQSLWVNFAEITIEPTGWTALWHISRATCEEMQIKYPTVVYGMVENVFYKELNSSFKVLAVEDENIQLLELNEVPLEDLYPTIIQENSEVNTPTTANGIDQLRFFYNHLWMPWDNDNDDSINFFQKTLQLRLKLYYDMKEKRIDQCLVHGIKNMLLEAQHLQKRREFFELDLSDSEDNENTIHTKDLIKLHLRTSLIKNEMDLLQNAEMRVAYKEININRGIKIKPPKHSCDIYLVLQEGNLIEKLNYLKFASKTIDKVENVITCTTLQEALTKSDNPDTIYIPSGEHKISFHESFKNNGTIKTIIDENIGEGANAIISTVDHDRILMSFEGDFTLKNVTLDCRNVDTGIQINNGYVVFENCKIFDDGKSSVKQGIVVMGKSTVKLINCIVTNFAIGITLKSEADVFLMGNTIITDCNIGIEMEDGCKLGLYDSKITNSKSLGVYYETTCLEVLNRKKQVFGKFDEINLKSVIVNQNFKFENNQNGNIVVCNKRMSQFVPYIKTNEIEDEPIEVNESSSVILIDDSFNDT